MELIVAQDHFLTPTVRHADIVLPATTFWERNDVHTPWAGAGHYAIYMKQAIPPMYECRDDRTIFADLAARLGIDDDDRTEEQWLRELTKGAVDDFEAFRENGVARFATPQDAVAFAAQIRDPENHKFTTPSGRSGPTGRPIWPMLGIAHGLFPLAYCLCSPISHAANDRHGARQKTHQLLRRRSPVEACWP